MKTKAPSISSSRAFSLIEILMAVGIMSIIIFTMVAMFDLVKRSFLAGNQQESVFEAGKATLDMVVADMEQFDASTVKEIDHLVIRFSPNIEPSTQELVGGDIRRNDVQDHYALRMSGAKWTSTGYMVLPEPPMPNEPMVNKYFGTLYRFSVTERTPTAASERAADIMVRPDVNFTNLNPVADGLISLTLRPLDLNGNFIRNAPMYEADKDMWRFHTSSAAGTSNSVPAYIELELAMIEPRELDRVRHFATREMVQQFIYNNSDKVHIFRRRVPFRTAPRPKE